MENYILRSVSLVFISVMIGCSTDPEIKKEDSFRYLTEADLKKTDFPAATQFKCPEDTQTVYGWSCPTNNVLASANAEGSSWQEIKCNTDFVYTNICVDKYEYPGVHSVPEKVSLEEAKNICMAREGHLCSQQEWRNSCTGNIKSPYGMSNFKRPEECNFDKPRKSKFYYLVQLVHLKDLFH